MEHTSKETPVSTHMDSSLHSAGKDGIAIKPPAYGIDLADFQVEGGVLQRQTTTSTGIVASPPPPENKTGLPDRLKAGVESLSGLSMDDVRVHYNSPKPDQVQALAYTQGTHIHVASGQEQHLPHEAWHVVQQKQGRVKPTLHTYDAAINDDAKLEREADQAGRKASNIRSAFGARQPSSGSVLQPVRTDVVQRVEATLLDDQGTNLSTLYNDNKSKPLPPKGGSIGGD